MHEANTLAVNALLGGATAAVVQMAKGGPVWDAFWTGALGGGTAYAGKRVAVEEFAGAGFLGRQIASLGGSLVRNATAGRPLLEEVVLPLGPVRLYVSKAAGVQPRLDVATLMAGAAFVIAYDARLDPAASLSAGALVFRGSGPTPGMSGAGATMVWAEMPEEEGPRLMAHERVHLLQYDQAFLSWADPLERWIAARAGAGAAVLRHFDFGGVVLGARVGLGLALEYSDRPWETEAYFLAELAHPVHGH
ncbi:MAG TPA: hypothetical protein VMM12_17615 [Longimicrobiales bacterium]|nr:hypothetical protein [Longimicrobiales bacterium]